MSNWKDVSSYGKGEDQTPKSWECRAGAFKMCVSRYVRGEPDRWYLSCLPWFDFRELKSTDTEEAKCQAKNLVQAELEKAISELVAK